jgi:hypothetical protein
MNWELFADEKPIKLKGLSKEIIQTLGNSNELFFLKSKNSEKTRLIKVSLINLGHKLEYKVYANKLENEDLEKVAHGFVNREWLFDLHFYTEKGSYSIDRLPLIVECEWYPRRKGDKNDRFSGFKYDFQKLLVSNAELRLMVFIIKKPIDNALSELETYFNNVITNYKHLEHKAKFLFVAFSTSEKSFRYKQIVKSNKNSNLNRI